MPVASYEITSKSAERNEVYAVVTMDNGTTFGQFVKPGTVEELDAQVLQAAARIEAEKQRPGIEAVTVGTVRTVAKPATVLAKPAIP